MPRAPPNSEQVSITADAAPARSGVTEPTMASVTSDTLQRSLAAARRDVRTYKGIGVSPGIAIGRAVIIEKREASVYRVPIRDEEVVDEAREKIRQALERLGTVHGVIIFTDMFGGTPSNLSLSFLEKDRVEIVTGVNLPMVVKFASMAQGAQDLATLAHVISEKGSKAIRVASDLLAATGERRAGASG